MLFCIYYASCHLSQSLNKLLSIVYWEDGTIQLNDFYSDVPRVVKRIFRLSIQGCQNQTLSKLYPPQKQCAFLDGKPDIRRPKTASISLLLASIRPAPKQHLPFGVLPPTLTPTSLTPAPSLEAAPRNHRALSENPFTWLADAGQVMFLWSLRPVTRMAEDRG